MSRVIVKREALLDSLHKIIATCERVHQSGKAASLPHFFYIRLDGYGDTIRLSAQNLHRRIEVMLRSISPHAPFCLGIPGEGFIALIKNLYDEHVELAVGGEGGLHLKVITPKCTYRLAAMDQDRFPVSEVVTIKDWQGVSFEDLFRCFSRIIYCTNADDSSRPHVKALCVTEDCFFCTDGFRISLIPNKIIQVPYPVMIPTESVKSFTNLFRDGGEDGYVFIEEQRLHFSKEGIYATTNLYNNPIPNYKSVVPSGACLAVSFSKQDAVRALKRLALFSKSLSKIALPLEVTFSDKIHMGFSNKEFRCDAEETLDCVYSGPKTTLSVNIKHLYEAIKSVQNEEIIIELRGSHYHLIITDAEGEHKNVITPCR